MPLWIAIVELINSRFGDMMLCRQSHAPAVILSPLIPADFSL